MAANMKRNMCMTSFDHMFVDSFADSVSISVPFMFGLLC